MSKLQQIREHKITDASSAMVYIALAFEVWGRALLSVNDAELYGIDMKQESEDRCWIVKKHTMNYLIKPDEKGDGSYTEVPYKKK